jgi:acetyl esterase/lipase
MRRSLLVSVVVFVAAATAGCFPLITPPGGAPLRYRDAMFSQASVVKTADIVYGSAVNLSNQTVTLKLDEYAPPASDSITSRPAIIWVHGGSFCCGNKTSGELVDESNIFASRGYVNFSIDYRLEPGGCTGSVPVSVCLGAIREALEDAQTAVRFVRTHAATYGVDPNRIAIGGSSAGAITAMNVAYSSSEDATSAVRAAQSLSGAALTVSPSAGDAPVIDFHGTADPLVAYSWATNTQSQAAAVGDYFWLTTFPGDGHVPYVQHHDQIISETSNFFYWELDLQHAAQ